MFTVVICFFAILSNNALDYRTSPVNFAGDETYTKPAVVTDSKVNPTPAPWTPGLKK